MFRRVFVAARPAFNRSSMRSYANNPQHSSPAAEFIIQWGLPIVGTVAAASAFSFYLTLPAGHALEAIKENFEFTKEEEHQHLHHQVEECKKCQNK